MSFEKKIAEARTKHEFKPGDIYEDSFYHPVLCTHVDYENDDISGISLIDGTQPRNCSLIHSGIRLLTLEESINIKTEGPQR
jgi:hypothetical protein